MIGSIVIRRLGNLRTQRRFGDADGSLFKPAHWPLSGRRGAGRAWRFGAAASVLIAVFECMSPQQAAHAAEPTDGQGNDGRTSYTTLPVANNVYQNCWVCSSYLGPGELFFENNPTSFFNDAQMMATARYGAAAQETQGVLPNGIAQRWEDTYAAALPAGTFPNAPANVEADRQAGKLSNDGAFVAWRDFKSGGCFIDT